MLSKSLPQQMLSKLLPTGEAQEIADLASALEMLVEGLAVHFLRCDDEERAQIPQVVVQHHAGQLRERLQGQSRTKRLLECLPVRITSDQILQELLVEVLPLLPLDDSHVVVVGNGDLFGLLQPQALDEPLEIWAALVLRGQERKHLVANVRLRILLEIFVISLNQVLIGLHLLLMSVGTYRFLRFL